MAHNVETRRSGQSKRASGIVLAGNNPEVAQNPVLFNQAAYIASRFSVSASVSRVLAEHAFAKGVSR